MQNSYQMHVIMPMNDGEKVYKMETCGNISKHIFALIIQYYVYNSRQMYILVYIIGLSCSVIQLFDCLLKVVAVAVQ